MNQCKFEDVVNLLRTIRAQGLKQYEVARKANIHETHFSRIVRGIDIASREERISISNALSVDEADIFGSEYPEKKEKPRRNARIAPREYKSAIAKMAELVECSCTDNSECNRCEILRSVGLKAGVQLDGKEPA